MKCSQVIDNLFAYSLFNHTYGYKRLLYLIDIIPRYIITA